jgi:hypothetical protein
VVENVAVVIESNAAPSIASGLKTAQADVRAFKAELTSAQQIVKQMGDTHGLDALAAANARVTTASAGLKSAQLALNEAVKAGRVAADEARKSYRKMAAEADRAALAASKSASLTRQGGNLALRGLSRVEGLGGAGRMISGAAGIGMDLAEGLGGLSLTAPVVAGAIAGIAGVVAGEVALYHVLSQFTEAEARAGEAIQRQSVQLVQQGQEWHKLRDFVAAAGDAYATSSQRIEALQGKSLGASVRGMTGDDALKAAEKTGMTPEQMQDLGARAQDEVRKADARIKDLEDRKKIGISDAANRVELAKTVPGITANTINRKADLAALDAEIDRQKLLKKQMEDTASFKGLGDEAKRTADAYDHAGFAVEALGKQLSSLGSKQDLATLNKGLGLIRAAKDKADPGLVGMSDDALRDEQGKEGLEKARYAAIEGEQSRRKQEQDQLDKIAARKVGDLKNQAEDAKDAGLFDVQTKSWDGKGVYRPQKQQRESDYTQREIDAATDPDQIRGLKHEKRGQQTSEGEKGLADAIRPAKEAYKELEASGTATSAQLVKANAAIKDSIDGWAASNKPLLAQLPDLKKHLEETYEATKIEAGAAAAKKFGEHTLALREKIESIEGAAVTKADQRKANEQAIALVLEQQHQGLLRQRDAAEILIGLDKQRDAIARAGALADKVQRQKNEDVGASIGAGKLAELEKEKSRGEGNVSDYQIQALKDQQLQHDLDLINRTKQAEIDAGVSTVLAEQHAVLEKEKLQEQLTDKYRDELRKRADLEDKQKQTKKGVGMTGVGMSALPDFGEDFQRVIKRDDGTSLGGLDDPKNDRLHGRTSGMQADYSKAPLPQDQQRVFDADQFKQHGNLGESIGKAVSQSMAELMRSQINQNARGGGAMTVHIDAKTVQGDQGVFGGLRDWIKNNGPDASGINSSV